ncbi:hypothetical protein FOQG_03624 [Fusarium oxysporum f. sp. raphani 54005]|uniref:Uncharacterized protein n=7 Tax=Fusarium oxysporum TaxID=5507 RepID=W9HW92_FUSOX|nr:hypothetical protein FOYG_11075 [Fusarium oxysporum NRRL 32931]EWZ35085.1 hypothetical protein FOZG_12814 [Fusarium oxysporum Fo47]EWZ94824.1 hypothetical protein FOWG_04973 [Fusarium oxysporum f. sp. lycopersici MN25]EXA39046.1 hypothetical protein FOVG_10739 [Fusarium oxysporum f. sp. pisi HDV247]EXK37728.1 hypothetical protein FOMG_08348 [Fusarium oxysporum f. sp. melonis 26406]EXK94796.1 hypothetical protein FOQG_03624 [Fusarium oxysporum f. sp. raphani 54005]EXL48800.1 hypothetical pr
MAELPLVAPPPNWAPLLYQWSLVRITGRTLEAAAA